MDAITYSSARANLASTMDRVCSDHEPLIITRNGEKAVVMLSLEDYKALEETAYLLRSPANARRLLGSIAQRWQGNPAGACRVKLTFSDEAWEDYLYWQKQERKMVERINKLIKEVQRDPFAGVGKPEPLKHALSGFWSRRITDEHRMVYRVTEDALEIAQLRFHY